MLKHNCPAPPARLAAQDSFHRFVFDGAAGEVLREYFQRDAEQARLSAKFRLYYRFRRWLPVRSGAFRAVLPTRTPVSRTFRALASVLQLAARWATFSVA